MREAWLDGKEKVSVADDAFAGYHMVIQEDGKILWVEERRLKESQEEGTDDGQK